MIYFKFIINIKKDNNLTLNLSMAKKNQKTLPKNVPAENVYMTAHWTVYVSYGCLLGSLYLLINGAFFGG